MTGRDPLKAAAVRAVYFSTGALLMLFASPWIPQPEFNTWEVVLGSWCALLGMQIFFRLETTADAT